MVSGKTLVGVTGDDCGDDVGSAALLDLKLIVTLLDVGSVVDMAEAVRVGVCGGSGFVSISGLSSPGVICPSVVESEPSTDLLLEPELDTRCLFLEDCSPSSNGFGRVEQGSEETARSRDDSSGSMSI